MLDNLPPEYIGGFLTGVIATLLGFGLTIIWDTIKYIRDRRKRDNAILSALRHEMQGNIDILRGIKKLLDDEIGILKDKKSYVTPLQPLHESMWRIIALNMPKKFYDKPDLLEALRVTTQDVMHIIEIINSRENYRVNNGGMTNYNDRLKIYDESITSDIPRVVGNLERLIQHV